MNRERIGYIDVAKGIGILLVAMGHTGLSLVAPYLHKLIYSFHMPLFFFLSGYFFNPNPPFLTLLKRRFNSVLKPYFFTIFLIYLTSVSFSNMGFVTALGRIVKAMYGTGRYIDWVQLWFLPSLFVTSLFAFFFYRLVLARIENRAFRWLVLLGLQAMAVYTLKTFYPFSFTLLGKEYELFGLPYSLDLVLLSGFFYILGDEIRQASLEKWLENGWFLAGTGAALLALTWFFPPRVDFNARIFESFPLNTVESILGILFVLALSKYIELHTVRLSAALKYIGVASLFILIFHVPIQEYWGAKIYFVTKGQAISIFLAFVISILISLGFYKVFVEQNPIAQFWYGRRSDLPPKEPDLNAKTAAKLQ
ncbi:MAG: acyltransferase family protein [Anaerolineales bacterium]